MSQCTTLADCVRELARVMDMTKDTKVGWQICLRQSGTPWWDVNGLPSFNSPYVWTFAVAIVEDKPVFVGDTLWHADGISCVVQYVDRDNKIVVKSASYGCCNEHSTALSWNPPKPKEPEIPEGYTRHDGGECPVHPDTIVHIVWSSIHLSYTRDTSAGDWLWDWEPYSNAPNIIAYKVIKPATVMVEFSVNMARYYAELQNQDISNSFFLKMREACRKALESINK